MALGCLSPGFDPETLMISAPIVRLCREAQETFKGKQGARDALSVKELRSLWTQIRDNPGDHGPLYAIQNSLKELG